MGVRFVFFIRCGFQYKQNAGGLSGFPGRGSVIKMKEGIVKISYENLNQKTGVG